MDKRYQIFVSSTYTDLREERQRVIQTLMEMDCIPSGMELFPAADEEQWEFMKKVIDDCDYYLLIIGGRYGSLTSEGLSYTEKEYDYAVEKGIKVIALIHGKPEEIPSGKSESEPELREKLNKFRGKVAQSRIVKFWEKASDLPGIVALSLSKTIKMYPAVGWVRADQIASTELLNEVNELRKNKERLETEVEKLKSRLEGSAFTAQEEADFNYIYSRIKGFQQAKCHVSRSDDKKNPNKGCFIKYSLIKALYRFIMEPDERAFRKGNVYDILNLLPKQVLESKSFSRYLRQGYTFDNFHLQERTKSLLATLGLLTPHVYTDEKGFGGKEVVTAFRFSEKLFRFISWLDYYDKVKDEPDIEFVEFLESAH